MPISLKPAVSALAVAATLGMGGFAPAADAAALKLAWSQDATGLDPHKQTAFSSIRLLELIYEPLVRLDPDLNIAPAIAESWEFSDDASELTFHLDPGAKFQSGATVTSADVKASFERILDEATAAATRANFTSITAIETPDDATVIFKLDGPNVPILNAMASVNAAVISAEDIAAGTVGTEVNGSGPFALGSWTPNASAVLTANPDWASGEVAIEGVDIRVLPDETAILAALRANQVDFALINDPLVATLVPGATGLTLNRTPTLSYHVLQLNAKRGAMQELGVRQAIACTLDRQEILDTALAGEGKITGPLTMPAYESDPETLFCAEPDVEKAKQLMADAGYADGFEATIMAATGEPPTAAAEAQVIQAQLAQIGIDLTIEMMELNVYVDRWLAADFDMAVALNGGRADPYTMYNRYWTKDGNLQKVAGYIDDTLDTLMQEGRKETDVEKRREIFAEFEQHLTEMAPWVWLYTGFTYTAQSDKVSGFTSTPTGSLFGLSSVTLAD